MITKHKLIELWLNISIKSNHQWITLVWRKHKRAQTTPSHLFDVFDCQLFSNRIIGGAQFKLSSNCENQYFSVKTATDLCLIKIYYKWQINYKNINYLIIWVKTSKIKTFHFYCFHNTFTYQNWYFSLKLILCFAFQFILCLFPSHKLESLSTGNK